VLTLYFEDLVPGRTFDCGAKTVTEEEIIRFGVEFDPQPFHIDVQAARASPFGGLIASGVHTFAIFTRLLADAVMVDVANLGGAGVNDLRWFAPVRPGDTLHARATILDGTRPSRSRDDRGVVMLRGELHRDDGALIWHATVISVVARRP